MEERLPHKHINRELKVRANFAPIMDLYVAHRRLKRDIKKMKPIPSAWRWMAKFARRIEGHEDWLDSKLALDYIRNEEKLGSTKKKGRTFLAELSPVPAPSNSKTRWAKIYGKRLNKKRDELIRKRIKKLGRALAAHKPKYVFAYGESYWKHYCKIAGMKFRVAVNLRGKFSRAKVGYLKKTTVVLLPFLNNRRFSTVLAKKIVNTLLS